MQNLKMKNKPQFYARGKCILEEKPFVYVLKSKYRTDRCDYCLAASEKVLKCSACQYVYYCNRECQKQAWPIHKAECVCLKRANGRVVPDAARTMTRIILKLNNGGDAEKSYYTEKFYRKFKDLMSHFPDIQTDQHRIEHIAALTGVLIDLLGEDLLPNHEELLAIYGRMVVNAFNILDQEMNSIATGIYLGVSVTDHSCKPNAVATFDGTTLYIRTIENLTSVDWSKIFISYVDLMDPTEVRRHDLKQSYYFLCECARCLDKQEPIEMNAAACSNTKCNGLVNLLNQSPNSNVQCAKCTVTIPRGHIESFKEVMTTTRMHLDKMKHSSLVYQDVCDILVKRQKGVLHPLNVWFLKTLDVAFESAIDNGKWEEACEYGTELIPGFKKYNGDFNPLLGLLYMKMGKIQLFKGRSKEALHSLNKASDIIKVTHGDDHKLYRQELVPLLIQAAAELPEE